MSAVQTIIESLHIENVEYSVDFPQVVVDFTICQEPHPAGDFQVGFSAEAHTYYVQGDALDMTEVLTAHPHLGNLDAQQAQELTKALDERLNEVYLAAGRILENALVQQREALLAEFNS